MVFLKRFSARDLIFYLLAILVMVFTFNAVQQMNEPDDPTYNEIRLLFEQEKVKYFSVEDNVLTLTLRGEGEDTSTLKYHLADFNVFYNDLHELIDSQRQAGIIQDYDYPAGWAEPWWFVYVPYLVILLGCGIHNSGCDESRHDGIHTFHIGKNCRVRYTEKHYGEDAKGETGKNIMNPQTIVYLGENSTMQMDTIQIRGIDSTLRDTQFYCEAGSEVVVTERLLTHGAQTAESDMTIQLNGEGAKGRVISRSVAQDTSRQVFHPVMVGNSQCFGHVQCDSIIMGQAHIESIPAITANCPDAQLIHEAAIGKIAGDQLLKLETLGLSPEEAEETILKGFLA